MIARRLFILALAAALTAPAAASAAMRRYLLDKRASRVGFRFRLDGATQKGEMPILRADIHLDAANLAASTVDVTLDAKRARTRLGFADAAMKGPKVLDAGNHPHIRFISRRITLGKGGRISDGATIAGDLQLRGVTKPITLQAEVYRMRGSTAQDLQQLDLRLSGQISRAAFGASGYAGMVADIIELDIRARIKRAV